MARPRKVCANCGHHVSTHEYTPDPEGRVNLPPAGCRSCACPGYRAALPFERVTRLPLTV
jgi:hypothetical protein